MPAEILVECSGIEMTAGNTQLTANDSAALNKSSGSEIAVFIPYHTRFRRYGEKLANNGRKADLMVHEASIRRGVGQ